MFCKNCGNQLNTGDNNCSNCGAPVVPNANNVANNMNYNNQPQQQPVYYNNMTMQQAPKKKSILKKVLIGFIIFIALIAGIITFVSLTSKKLVCKSSEGNITLMYKGDKLTGYTVKNATFDLDKANETVKVIGLDEYLKEFEAWFKANSSDGTCEYK